MDSVPEVILLSDSECEDSNKLNEYQSSQQYHSNQSSIVSINLDRYGNADGLPFNSQNNSIVMDSLKVIAHNDESNKNDGNDDNYNTYLFYHFSSLETNHSTHKFYSKIYRYIDERCEDGAQKFDYRFLNISNEFDFLLNELKSILELVFLMNVKMSQLGQISEEIIDGQAVLDDGSFNVLRLFQKVLEIKNFNFKSSNSLHNVLEKKESSLSKELFHKHVYSKKDLNNLKLSFHSNLSITLPQATQIIREPIKVGDFVWALTSLINSFSATWNKAKIFEIPEPFSKGFYKVSFFDSHMPDLFLKSNQIAYFHSHKVLLKNATKVVALLNYENNTFFKRNQLFSGVIAEPPKRTNKFRYLVFFDSGHSAYVNHNHVFSLVEDNISPSNDIPNSVKRFRKKYFKDYPERAMVKFQINEKIKVLVNSIWTIGRVEQIDCSLVKLYYKNINKYEWIFRGSFRLQPLSHFETCISPKKNLIKPRHRAIKKTTDQRCKNFRKRSSPFVQYTIDVSDDEENFISCRQVAKKSTSKTTSLPSFAEHTINQKYKQSTKTRSLNYEYNVEIIHKPKRRANTKLYINHSCGLHCLKDVNESYELFRNENPFTIPIIFGWERQQAVYRLWSGSKQKIFIYYIAPCGRRLKSIQEVDYYLNITKSLISIDFFTFSSILRLYVEYNHGLVQKCHYYEKDIANGTENHSISVINSESYEKITNFSYSASRFANEKVNLNLDPNFLPCCDCKDNCRNRNYCQCQQITMESSYITPIFNKSYAGYKHRRLPYVQMSGIFECNSRCPCNNCCPNRLVQMGIRVKLQIFRTKEKGWGIRTLHDIPRGTFICVYAAELLDHSMADDHGMDQGDEYLADLDYIDSIESMKLGYESAVEEEISSDENSSSSDDESKTKIKTSCVLKEDLSSKRFKLIENENLGKKPFIPIRTLFNEQYAYTLDAKKSGNIGRYLNHSCEPNCFVQNVFIDTHDLRFPWVSFFAGSFIPAFSEITWNYHYEYDPDSEEKLHCYCRSKRCQGRLL